MVYDGTGESVYVWHIMEIAIRNGRQRLPNWEGDGTMLDHG